MAGVFLGSPSAAVPSLAAFCNVEDVAAVITQPDRPAGRGRILQPPAVKLAAREFGLPVHQPTTTAELQSTLERLGPTVGLVVAYGRILTPAMLDLVPGGFLNVHFSLLPRWRGAAPVQHAIAAGDTATGVTLMLIDEGLDTGPVLGELSTAIAPNETSGSLTGRLSHLGATLVDSTIPEYLNGRRRPVPQLTTGDTHAAKVTRSDALLGPSRTSESAERAVRAYWPRPGAWLETDAGVLKVAAARPSSRDIAPGRIEQRGPEVVAGFADGAIELLEVQPQGRQVVDAVSWMHGRRGEPVVFSDPA